MRYARAHTDAACSDRLTRPLENRSQAPWPYVHPVIAYSMDSKLREAFAERDANTTSNCSFTSGPSGWDDAWGGQEEALTRVWNEWGPNISAVHGAGIY